MLRRQARERKEYLYRKAQQLQEETQIAKRAVISQALATGKALPKEIADDAKLQKDYIYDESHTKELTEDIDDEYSALSGLIEPKVLITTSRNPSVKLTQFTKELKLLIPNSIRINRGNYIIKNLIESCQASSNITDVIIVHEHRGIPTTLTLCHLPHGPTIVFTLHNVKLRHDLMNIANQSEIYPHLIFENFDSKLGKRVNTILKNIFPPGVKQNNHRVISFINQDDFIHVRQHVYVKTKGNGVELSEVGPRFTMRLFEIKLGQIDDKNCEVEFMLRRFLRTGNRKNYLSDK